MITYKRIALFNVEQRQKKLKFILFKVLNIFSLRKRQIKIRNENDETV